MPVFNNVLAGAAGQTSGGDATFKIERSLRFNDDDSAYLNRTPSSAGNRKTWTFSTWCKIATPEKAGILLNAQNGTNQGFANNFWILFYAGTLVVGDGSVDYLNTNKLRDPSAWYHIVVACDTTQSSPSDRLKIYINGVESEYTGDARSSISQNSDTTINSTYLHRIGDSGSYHAYFDGYLADTHLVDGQALAPTNFGEFSADTGVWNPIEFTGSYNAPAGTNYSSQTITNENSGYPTARMFDGVYGSSASLNNSVIANLTNGTYSVYTFANPISYSSSVRIYGDLDTRSTDPDIKANNTSVTGFTNNTGLDGANKKWYTVLSGSGTLSTVSLNQHNGYVAAIYAIEVDGTVLVSSSAPAGVNGFHLDFSDNSSDAALGTDAAGSNNWTVNNLSASGGASAHAIDLDGDDSISYPVNLNNISGDFTFECHFWKTGGSSGWRRIFSTNEAAQWYEQTFIRLASTTGYVSYAVGGSSPNSHTHNAAVTDDVWHHAAIVREGNTIGYFYDGARVQTQTVSSSFSFDMTTLVVGKGYGSEYFTGKVHGARFTEGQALYSTSSATYTRPSAPITTTSQGAASSNVKLLAGTTSTVNENLRGTNGTNDGNPTAVVDYPFGGAEGQDSLLDSPTNYDDGTNIGGNYATFNPLDCDNGTLSNGNLTTNQTNTSTSFGPQNTTIGVSSGKWYCEFTFDSGSYALVGITHAQSAGKAGTTWHRDADTYTWYFSGAFMSVAWPGTSTFPDGSSPTFTAGDVIGVLLDKDNDKLYFTKNGSYVASMNAATGANGIDISAHSGKTAFFTVGNNASTATQWTLNAGQRPFAASSIPTGYKSLCTQNLDDPLIEDPSTVFDIKTWQGDGVSNARTISGYSFSPDLVWGKTRTAAYRHMLYDTVRGAGKDLRSDTDAAEGTNDQYGYLSAFNSNGFTTSSGSTDNDHWNHQSKNYVAWAWDAGSSNTSISVGGLNSSVYNQNQTWSTGVSGSGSGGNHPSGREATYAFDGDLSSRCSWTGTTDPVLTATLPTAISATTLRVKGHFWKSSSTANEDVLISINGGTYVEPVAAGLTTYAATTAAGGTLFIDCTSLITGGQVSSVSMKRRGSVPTTTGLSFYAIEVDGKILVDSNQTPANVPSIASTTRANPTAGFSIASYSGNSTAGATVAHGLNAAPELLIIKNRNGTHQWPVYFKVLGAGNKLQLNETAASASTSHFNSTEPTSFVFSVGGTSSANNNGNDLIAYCFHSVPQYSKFGVYTGNGSSSDGTFVWTGFRPRFVCLKNTSSSQSTGGFWVMIDTERDSTNNCDNYLQADSHAAEGVTTVMDILSNGFKLTNPYTSTNGSGIQYVYLAFAESPFKYSRAR